MKYKTIKQLDAEMNIGKFYCNCMNSGVNSFTGMCSNCGMRKQPDSEKLDKLIGHLYEKFGKKDKNSRRINLLNTKRPRVRRESKRNV